MQPPAGIRTRKKFLMTILLLAKILNANRIADLRRFASTINALTLGSLQCRLTSRGARSPLLQDSYQGI